MHYSTGETRSMADYAGMGRELVAKADKRLHAFSLFGASIKHEDAAEMLERAANQFKLAKACECPLPLSRTGVRQFC